MKKIQFSFQGQDYTIEVERHGHTLTIHFGGQQYKVILAATAVGSAPPAAQPAPFKPPHIAAGHVDITVGEGVLLAPMTGIVKDVKVREGDQVSKGQLVMIMEAMKMDIDVYASASGVVRAVTVKAGDNVAVNQRLLAIE